jgi:hypothetical protein
MKSGRLTKTENGWWIAHLDYKKKPDGTAHGKPVEVLLEVDPGQIDTIETMRLRDTQVEFQEVLLHKDPDWGWIEPDKALKNKSELPSQNFARLILRSQAEIDSDFLETLREFAWEMWKAGATAEDQRRESFDRFYSDFSESAQGN